MKKNSVAFICPLYDMKNHFDLAYDLYQSKIKYRLDIDLIFIFSNEEQKNKFKNMVEEDFAPEKLKYSILPDKLDKYSAKANVKKLYGLKTYMNDYEYIILTDCEAKFVRHFNAKDVAQEIWESKSVLSANKSAKGFFIMRECYKTMGLYFNKTLRKALENFKYNFWFNELQVYKCSLLPGFFSWLDGLNKEAIFNTWSCFEYYVFYAYLFLEFDIPIKKNKYISLGGINEYLYWYKTKKQEKILKEMHLHWTTSFDVKSENICMLFHLDREKDYYKMLESTNSNIIKQAILLRRKVKRNISIIILSFKRYFTLLAEFPQYLYYVKKQ